MNIIITLAGKSLRFKSHGYKKEKFLLYIDDKSIILEKVIEMFNFNDSFHFIISKSQSKIPNLKKTISKLTKKNTIHIINDHNYGPAYSVLNIKEINDSEPIIISYCDFFVDWDYKRFLRNIYDQDGSIPVFKGFHPSSFTGTLYGYIKSDKKKFIKLREKFSFTKYPEKENASCGIYYFKSFRLYKYYAKKFISKTKKEAYVSLIYNLMQKDKLKINIFEVKKFICLGTPYDYEIFRFWNKFFLKNINFRSQLKFNNYNLIPMSGEGKRFKNYGYRVPKPLIEINKMPMLELVSNTFPKSSDWIFVINNNDNKNNRIIKLIKKINNNSKVIKVNKLTEGPASSCNLAKNLIDDDKSLFISSCDYLTVYNENKFKNLIKDKSIDGIIWTSKLKNQIVKSFSAFGYCKTKNDKVIEIIEKKTVSKTPKNDHMMIGSFWFRKSSYFFKSFEEAKKKKFTINNEYYVGNNINLLIKKKLNFIIFEVDQWISFGDPFEMRVFEYWKDLYKKKR